MRALRLAISLIRVPKLFATLLLWPLFIGLGIAATQVMVSATFVQFMDEDVHAFEKRLHRPDNRAGWIREQLYGNHPPFKSIAVCRWTTVDGKEAPPNAGCEPKPLDVALRVEDPRTFDSAAQEKFFMGSIERLHLCTSCKTDIVMRLGGTEDTISDVYSLKGLGVFMLTESAHEGEVTDQFIAAKTIVEQLQSMSGTILLHPSGFPHAVNISKASTIMILVINIAFLIVITLWLSLVGHRKVLHYFARNDALLPLVAACGKENFYSALWFITLLRVTFFLVASLPATYLIYVTSIPEDTLSAFAGDRTDFLLWLSGIISSLGVMTVIASISELKHRHSLVSFLYKYIPVLCFLVGTCTWVYTLFHAGQISSTVQFVVSSLPLFGISPIILSPLLRCDPTIVALHTILSAFLIVLIFRLNSRWFAAHLEEI